MDYAKVWTNVFSISLLQDGSPCIIHCTCSTNESRITLQKFSTWKVLLNTAKIRKHEQILKQVEELKQEEIPVLQYHRQYYQQFTHKSLSNALTRKHEKTKEKFQTIMQNILTYETDERPLEPKRTSSSSSNSTLLPQDKCIFCDKTKEYKSKKAENLCTCDSYTS